MSEKTRLDNGRCMNWFPFSLTPSQVNLIRNCALPTNNQVRSTGQDPDLQVILRICCLGTTSQELDDAFPQGVAVFVNFNVVLQQTIPPPTANSMGIHLAPRRLAPKVVNISNFVSRGVNKIRVDWMPQLEEKKDRHFAISVYLVKRLRLENILQRVISNGKHPESATQKLIEELARADAEESDADVCLETDITVSTMCPVGKRRMKYPCRSTKCNHLQCFDAVNFLLMSESITRPLRCPVCSVYLKVTDLKIDEFFQLVLAKLHPHDKDEIRIFPDGHWASKIQTQEIVEIATPSPPPPPKRRRIEDAAKDNISTIASNGFHHS